MKWKKRDPCDMMISVTTIKNPWWKRILIWLHLMKNPIINMTVLKTRYGGSTGCDNPIPKFGLMNVDCEDIDKAFLSPVVITTLKTHSYDPLLQPVPKKM